MTVIQKARIVNSAPSAIKHMHFHPRNFVLFDFFLIGLELLLAFSNRVFKLRVSVKATSAHLIYLKLLE